MPDKTNLLDLTPQQLADYFVEIGEKPYRASQLVHWVHQLGVVDFVAMNNFGLKLRDYLHEHACLKFPEIVTEKISSDGTRKYLVRLDDNTVVETVFIPEDDRATLCVSSQVGCPLNCGFCATATLGFKRNLSLSEIIGQLWLVTDRLAKSGQFAREKVVTNVVMMGMGEPLLNFNNVVAAMDIMLNDLAYGLSKYRVTLSTSGVVPEMWHLREVSPVALAVSLHAPTDELRNRLMPINKKYSLAELMGVCREYFKKEPRRSITFEYVMIDKVNDSIKHAKELVCLLEGIKCKVNLIPFNEFSGSKYKRSSTVAIDKFHAILMRAGINTITRKTRGSDIAASCGQLVGEGC